VHRRFIAAAAAVVALVAAACVVPPNSPFTLNRHAAGTFTGESTLDLDSPCMSVVYDLDVQPKVGTPATLHVDVCHLEEITGQERFRGPFTYTLEGGQLRGDATGTKGPPNALHMTLQATGGEGMWCDVRGTLDVDGTYTIALPPAPPVVVAAGSLSADLAHDPTVDCATDIGGAE
jgi:hypothetical protein